MLINLPQIMYTQLISRLYQTHAQKRRQMEWKSQLTIPCTWHNHVVLLTAAHQTLPQDELRSYSLSSIRAQASISRLKCQCRCVFGNRLSFHSSYFKFPLYHPLYYLSVFELSLSVSIRMVYRQTNNFRTFSGRLKPLHFQTKYNIKNP